MDHEMRERIADVFERRVETCGYAGAVLDDVAREMRISKKTIYAHFSAGKREIYAYVVERIAREQRARMHSAVKRLTTNRAKIQALLEMLLSMGRGHIAETSTAEWLAEYEIAADAFRKANGELLRRYVRKGMESGEFAAGDPEFAESMIAAMMLAYLMLVNEDPAYDRDEELIERTLGFIGS